MFMRMGIFSALKATNLFLSDRQRDGLIRLAGINSTSMAEEARNAIETRLAQFANQIWPAKNPPPVETFRGILKPKRKGAKP
jgi:hypothetical protein